ncbi:MAG: hypothetical protein JNK37_06560 [Verrucomicrobiales bacterium]|nr:hypothetical protein [Verrucomicrobiales bacterium]
MTHPSRLYQIRTGLDPPPGRASLAGLDALSVEQEETLVATAPHPFFVWSRPSPAFVAAEDLGPGDRLRLAGGGSATVLAVSVEEAPAGKTFTAHNLHVAEYHTYHVGRHGVWVHNFSTQLCDDVIQRLMKIQERLGINDL